MKFIFSFGIILFFFASCGGDQKPAGDSLQARPTPKDSVKEAFSDLPPPSDIRQFKWFYSFFVKTITTKNEDSLFRFEKFIHPELGLYIIEANGAVPYFRNVRNMKDFKTLEGNSFFTISRDDMICDPLNEELPKVDCDSKDLYNKTGCFTQESNPLKDDQPWQFSHLSPEEEKKVEKAAAGVTRTVINTKNYRYYFSLIDGSWYVTFIDMRRPCSA